MADQPSTTLLPTAHESPDEGSAAEVNGPGPTPVDDPEGRVRACSEAIDAVLREHRCVIAPVIGKVETVGREPVGKVQVEAAYQILPLQ